ncbi:MAG: ABC-F family ATP-binding cassette domain-containing protein, partial [Lentisphaeria bacterium]|nr:ATP-binding cassette domain-containing protein [Lentisphaeria bacterium]NQZ69412.1 ABC-F family ATP-binding cassette domain-containing protein [Lentisphaeria bacterium]
MSIVFLKDASVRYGDRVILNKINYSIVHGERVGLVGRNGEGKSTMLKILAGLMVPHEGEMGGRNNILTGFLPQEFDLDDSLTVYENIESGARHISALLDKYESGDYPDSEQGELEAELTRLDGWNLDVKIQQLMSALKTPMG